VLKIDVLQPEVLLNEYTYKVDIWSIGVIAYILLCGFAPFAGDSDLDTLHLVRTGPLEFPSPEWDDISAEAKDFVTQLLDRDPITRPTADEAMHHPWIAKHVVEPGIPKPIAFRSRSTSESSTLRLNSERKAAFQKFLHSIKIKKTLDSVSDVMTPSEASFLGKLFRRVDKDHDGKIRLEDLDSAVKSGTFLGWGRRPNVMCMARRVVCFVMRLTAPLILLVSMASIGLFLLHPLH
jgi:calcium-dependent protein kinase